jgi:alcohol dehydrogenase, propanol-preferring
VRERPRQRALEAGADVALDGQGLSAADVREAVGGRGATVFFDFVGTDETLALAAATIAMSGHVSLVGIGGGTLPMAFGTLPFEWSMSKPSWGSLPELHEVVALARAGTIRIDVERFGLEQAIDGYRRLRNGDVDGRAVVLP